MIVQFRNEKVSNHGSIPITIDCNVVAFIVFEEVYGPMIPPAHKAHQTLSNDENADFIILNNKLSTVRQIIEELSQLKHSYFTFPDDTDLKDALDVIIDIQAETQELEVRIEIILSQFKKTNSTNDNEIIKNKIKLPDLPLPTFREKFQEFELFKSQFMNVIGNNSSLNNTQKLCYLKSALKNDASLIQSDQDSFESLMESLINRYENKRVLVDIHITEMLSEPKIQSENPAELRFLIDTVRSRLRSLKNLRMDSNVLSDAILLYMLNSKIDRESQILFQLNLKTTEVPSLQDFFSFLETRCIQLESIRKTDFDTKNIPENVNLRDSRSIASKRLDQLGRRLDRDPKLNNLYTKFIEEYLSLDHMEEITNIDDITSEGFFLPHHGVLRAGNRSRPLRVVFNGSQKN
ncbi:DUF1758 domain-containing protein [Trichonephila clavipes]|nr:DUF1758 domain-containing protein [Trichonephila clavipes]